MISLIFFSFIGVKSKTFIYLVTKFSFSRFYPAVKRLSPDLNWARNFTFILWKLDESASFSPDGQLIAFDSYRDGNYELLVMNANGQNERQITNTGTRWNRLPKWSPDGKRLVFTSQRDGLGDIYTLEYASGSVSRLTTNEDVNGYNDSPSFTPDGKTVIFHTLHTITE